MNMQSLAHMRTHEHYTHVPHTYTHLTKETVDTKQSAISHMKEALMVPDFPQSQHFYHLDCKCLPIKPSALQPPSPAPACVPRAQEGLLFSQNPLPSRHPFQMPYTWVQATRTRGLSLLYVFLFLLALFPVKKSGLIPNSRTIYTSFVLWAQLASSSGIEQRDVERPNMVSG